MWKHQSDDLAECQREGAVLRYDFLPSFKDQSRAWRNGISFGLNDPEALMNVAFEAKERITAHRLKHQSASVESLRFSGYFIQIVGNNRPVVAHAAVV